MLICNDNQNTPPSLLEKKGKNKCWPLIGSAGYGGAEERNKSNPFHLIKPAVRQVWAIKNHCPITRTFSQCVDSPYSPSFTRRERGSWEMGGGREEVKRSVQKRRFVTNAAVAARPLGNKWAVSPGRKDDTPLERAPAHNISGVLIGSPEPKGPAAIHDSTLSTYFLSAHQL